MAENLSGYWFLDSIDLWDGFKCGIIKGSTDALRYPPKKESITYSWADQNGLDVDLTTPKFEARDINLQCFIVCQDTEEFWDNHNALINQLMAPGFHSLKFASHGLEKIYGVEYRKTSNYEPVKSLKTDPTYNVHRFTLELRELEPNIGESASRLTDEDGNYIIS